MPSNKKPEGTNIKIELVKISDLKSAQYNPRKWDEQQLGKLAESISKYGVVDPIIVNDSKERRNIVIGGHMRVQAALEVGLTEIPVVYLDIPDETREKELNLRLNKNSGSWDYELLADFDESLLADVGFDSKELDGIFDLKEITPESFDLQEELDKLDFKSVQAHKGDVYQLGEHRLMVGDSTIAEDFDVLMNGEYADMCLTDEPYLLSYMSGGIRQGKPVEEKGIKRHRKYLETDEIPEDFVELWMANVARYAKPDFSIIAFEAWHNLVALWQPMSEHWRIRNMLVWHIPSRNQGFSAKYKFFSKYDIALIGGSGTVPYNADPEEGPMQEMYETALFATSGSPHWEEYEKGTKLMPTDHITYDTNDKKYSGQDIIFGTKPLDVLMPYMKVLTKRGDLVVDCFGGSGSTMIATDKLGRRCYMMEKSPVYAEVILKRWEKETGQTRVKIHDGSQPQKT